MANQELYDKNYPVPQDVRKYVNGVLVSHPHGDGVKRAKNIINNGYLTYQALKKLKHDFETLRLKETNPMQYELAGGDLMKAFVDTTLNGDRHAVASGKRAKQDMTANPNSELMPHRPAPRLNEEKKKELDQNAVAVIVNNDNKILLLKRSDYEDQWMPSKWALVGGGIDNGEDAETACKREIEEETGLEINKFVESFKIQRHEDSEETIFACRHEGEDTEVELDMKENVKYGWYDMSEMEYLDTVPHLIEYITMVFKKYD